LLRRVSSPPLSSPRHSHGEHGHHLLPPPSPSSSFLLLHLPSSAVCRSSAAGAAAAATSPALSLPHQHHDYGYDYYHHHQPPPHYVPYDAPYGASPDEVRTLFVAGLPGDVRPREIYNLFREFPGYESSHLRNSGKSSQAYAFAVFRDQQSAIAAMHALNGMIFDLEKEYSLHVDLARSNSRSKRSRADDGVAYSSDKRLRGSTAYSRGLPDSGAGSNIHMPGMGNSAYSLNGYPSTQSRGIFGQESDDRDLRKSSPTFAPQDNPPCPTIFVANLGPTCSQEELAQVFSRCPGFLKLKMQNKSGAPVAFVDFKDVNSSAAALNRLQGTILYSSSEEGMRLEYAKSRMGLRKREKRR
ncbi:RNA-binding protein with multiple splicing 2, partial [Ananas comosus]